MNKTTLEQIVKAHNLKIDGMRTGAGRFRDLEIGIGATLQTLHNLNTDLEQDLAIMNETKVRTMLAKVGIVPQAVFCAGGILAVELTDNDETIAQRLVQTFTRAGLKDVRAERMTWDCGQIQVIGMY